MIIALGLTCAFGRQALVPSFSFAMEGFKGGKKIGMAVRPSCHAPRLMWPAADK